LASIATDVEKPTVINGAYDRDVAELFDGNPMFGTRKLLHVGIQYYTAPVVRLYIEEIERWTTE
jgi:hypothetical protein